MEPQIVKKPALTLVGVQRHGKLEGLELKSLWNEFGPRMAEVTGGDPDVCYGAMDHYDEATGEFDYLAACEAKGATDVPAVPDGMVSWNIPAQTYALFPGSLPEIGAVWQFAYQQWLPTSGYQRAAGPEFELYDEKFDPQDPASVLYICVPVVNAN
ncbi:MAG: AraC family transcriptional regulator [Chloroflexi bacterium]|nr:AraC family transcriptional regulator [Chloroflexota bacterium]